MAQTTVVYAQYYLPGPVAQQLRQERREGRCDTTNGLGLVGILSITSHECAGLTLDACSRHLLHSGQTGEPVLASRFPDTT
jgi:hypothetical protein